MKKKEYKTKMRKLLLTEQQLKNKNLTFQNDLLYREVFNKKE